MGCDFQTQSGARCKGRHRVPAGFLLHCALMPKHTARQGVSSLPSQSSTPASCQITLHRGVHSASLPSAHKFKHSTLPLPHSQLRVPATFRVSSRARLAVVAAHDSSLPHGSAHVPLRSTPTKRLPDKFDQANTIQSTVPVMQTGPGSTTPASRSFNCERPGMLAAGAGSQAPSYSVSASDRRDKLATQSMPTPMLQPTRGQAHAPGALPILPRPQVRQLHAPSARPTACSSDSAAGTSGSATCDPPRSHAPLTSNNGSPPQQVYSPPFDPSRSHAVLRSNNGSQPQEACSPPFGPAPPRPDSSHLAAPLSPASSTRWNSTIGGDSGGIPPSPSPPSAGRQKGQPLVTADEDTIAAVVTGAGTSGCVDIIRLSGTEAVTIVRSVFKPTGSSSSNHSGWQPESHHIYHGKMMGQDGAVLDEVLVLVMLSPRSYTREDVIEVQCHGGGMCCQRILRMLVAAGARFARPGEFTLRAFLNGRLDLSQAESVTQLMSSQTPAAADSALLGLQGGIGAMVGGLRRQCLELVAEMEAHMDFDDDLEPLDVDGCKAKLESIQHEIEEALRTAKSGRLLRNGLQVALVGRPNVGKSSLLNALTRTNRAIVSDIAGTTRDVLDAGTVLGGVPVTLVDTAGVRGTTDTIERLGVERSAAAARSADIVIMVVDADAGWTEGDAEVFRSFWGDGPSTRGCKVLAPACLVANKMDLTDHHELSLPLLCREVFGGSAVFVSAVSRQGLDRLEHRVLELVGAPQLGQGSVGWAVNERQAEALIRAHGSLMEVVNSMRNELPVDCWTVDLRAALQALGEVSGDNVTEEVLDSIFSRFCIGK